MAFPSSNTGLTLNDALNTARSRSQWIKGVAQNARTAMAAGPVDAAYVLQLLDNLRGAKAALLECSSVPGIGPYAEEQVANGAGANIGTKFTTMMAAIDAAGAWIVTTFPKDAQGRLLAETWGADGARIPVSFPTAATAPCRTLLDALVATID